MDNSKLMSKEIYYRDNEINLITEKIKSNNVIIVSGISGVGKTSIVKEALKSRDGKVLNFSYLVDNPSQTLKLFFNSAVSYIIQKETNILKKAINYFNSNEINLNKFGVDFDQSNFTTESLSQLSIVNNDENMSVGSPLANINFKKSKIILNGTDYIVFFKKFWKLINKDEYTTLYISNIELLKNKDDFKIIKAFLQFLPTNIKVIFEIGTLYKTNYIEKLIEIINDVNLEYDEVIIKHFEYKQALELFNKIKNIYHITEEFNYDVNRGIPLSMIMPNDLIEGRYNISKNLENDFLNQDTTNLLILLTIFYEVDSSYEDISRIARNIGISFENIKFQKLNIVSISSNKIELSHPIFYYKLSQKYQDKILEVLFKVFNYLHSNNDIYLYYFLKFKYIKRYNYNLESQEQLDFIKLLIELLKQFNLKYMSSFISLKENFLLYFDKKYQPLINLIEIQYNIYNFRLEESNFFSFNNEAIQLVSNILYLQYAYHLDDFEKVLNESIMIKKKIKEKIYVLEDKDLIEYFTIILNALEGVSQLALSQYNTARQNLHEALKSSQINGYEDINHYLTNLTPFIDGFDLAKEDINFNNTVNINNEYIKTKRLHNICAINLYTNYKSRTLERDINQIIESFKKINSLEISYSYNNLLVFYIINNKHIDIKKLINLIDTITFESYDKISFYNNAIVANIIIKDTEQAKVFFIKALKLIEEEYFTDKSFLAKIYLNGAILFNILEDNENMNKYLSLIDLNENYDDYELVNDKISFIKNHKVNDDLIYSSEIDIRHKYIYWIQIIHFWDFDIPVLNEKIITYLLNKISIK